MVAVAGGGCVALMGGRRAGMTDIDKVTTRPELEETLCTVNRSGRRQMKWPNAMSERLRNGQP